MIACASKYFASHHESYQGYRELRLSFASASDMRVAIIVVEARGTTIGVLPFARQHADHPLHGSG